MEEWLLREEPRPVKLTVDDFLLLADAGAFDGYGRTELIEGVIVEMAPMRTRHASLVGDFYYNLRTALKAFGSPLTAMLGPTVKLPPHNAPEPDVVVVQLGDDRYLPGEAAALAVEVSVSTLRHDLTVKRDIYARAGVPEYWVVDGEANVVHQFWNPRDGIYAETRVVALAGELASATLPGILIDATGF
ncbi:Uma2 family endonuclease [Sphingomonas bacterium]|uniref:Uma2 family endonuclease n=1 Tax=Sphingomonas bacterium TaxID=1895847 RepID=UPI001576BEA4|nr:Uma2 family endonuclease [Sphingomonas bacterium]